MQDQRDRWQCFPPKSFFTFSIPFYVSIASKVVLSTDLKNSKNQKLKLSPFLFMVDFFPIIFLSPPCCHCCLNGLDRELILWVPLVAGRQMLKIQPSRLDLNTQPHAIWTILSDSRKSGVLLSIGEEHTLRILLSTAPNLKPQSPRPESHI